LRDGVAPGDEGGVGGGVDGEVRFEEMIWNVALAMGIFVKL
jgi:hypothetical protein